MEQREEEVTMGGGGYSSPETSPTKMVPSGDYIF